LLPYWEDFISLKWFSDVKYPEYLQNEVNFFIGELAKIKKRETPTGVLVD